MSNNLNRTTVTATQDSKEVTINDSDGVLDAALTAKLTTGNVVYAGADANKTPSVAEFRQNVYFLLSGSTSNAAPTFQLPSGVQRGLFVVANTLVKNIIVSQQSGTVTSILPPGEKALFLCDGTDVHMIAKLGLALDWKESCRAATTAAITISTALNNGDSLDGITLATGDRVLVKDQAAPAENGIYVVGVTPVRSSDADSPGDITAGMTVNVTEGTVNAERTYMLSTNDPITIDTTGLTFQQLSGATGATGIYWVASVRVATTANGTLATSFENGDTIDGVVLATNDRILLKDQSTAADNGIYIVQASGAPVRATDYDLGTTEVKSGTAIPVREGTANANKIYILVTLDPITVGSTGLSFFLFGVASYGTAVSTQTGTTYTYALADANTYVRHNNAGAITVTVPANGTVAFPTGTQISGIQAGAGQVTFAAAGGVTINTPETLKCRKNKSTFCLTKVGADEWDLSGDLELV